MNFGKFDAIMLLTMTLAIISMSFVFPAIGLSDNGPADENNIPEFDISADRFDFAGGFPPAPSTPTEGTLEWNENEISDNKVWLNGDTNGGYEMFLASEEINGAQNAYVRVNRWNTSGTGEIDYYERVNFTSEGDINSLIIDDYGIRLEVTKFAPPEYAVKYELVNSPRDREGFIGSIFGIGSATAQTLVWLGTIFFWVSTFIVELGLNTLGLAFDVLAFFINLASWQVTTYTGIISAASGFASVFVAIPGIILSIMFGKIVIIGIGLLPTT